MRHSLAIAKREIFSYFASPVAYAVMAVWLAWTGATFFFLTQFYARSTVSGGMDTPLTAFFGQTALFYMPLLVFVPLLTMRLVAAETHSGTLEPLLTTRVSTGAVIFGKYVAGMAFWVVLWLPTLLYAWLISRYGTVDLGALGASYLGIFTMGAYYIGIGLLASVVAPTPIISAVLTFCVLGLLFLAGIGEHAFEGSRSAFFAYINVLGHMANFSKGVVDSRHLVFDLSAAAFCLFSAYVVLATRRSA